PQSGFGTIQNLASVRLDEKAPNPLGMGVLLKALRDAGADTQARDLVSARERVETHRLWRQACSDWNLAAAVRAASRTGVWGLLSDYGRSPGIALVVALILTAVMTGIYFVWGFPAGATSPGICQVHSKGRIEPSGHNLAIADADRVARIQVSGGLKKVLWAALVSLLSGCRIGVGQFNLIELFKRLSSAEFGL